MWLPNHIHTTFSVLDGIIQPDKLAKKCKEFGYSHCSITDHGNICGAVKFSKEMQKEGIAPVIGNEFYMGTTTDRESKHTVVMAKNLQGWNKLIKLTSLSNKQFYYKPRITFKDLADNHDNDLIVFSGHWGSIVGDSMDDKDALMFKEAFGDDFYLEVQNFIDKEQADKIREMSRRTGIRAVACADSHYIEKKDAVIHRITLCSNLKTTLREIRAGLANGTAPMATFFEKDCFFLPSEDDLRGFGHTEEEIDCSDILAKIDKYSILIPPIPPKFNSGKVSEIEYLKEVCRKGWKKKYRNVWNTKEYVDRLNYEFSIIEEFDLAGYLLIVWDYIKYCKDRGVLVGAGRGSSAGSLVCYLSGITEINPIEHDLMFERFINTSRFYKDN